MKSARALLVTLSLATLCACTGGGGGGTTISSVAAWEKFRHDIANTGQGGGTVATNNGQIKWQTQIDGSPIPSSPAIGTDGTIYVGTEGGTLAALDPKDGTSKWAVSRCDFAGSSGPNTCLAGEQAALGQLISSPAVYAFNARTNVFIGSSNGTLFTFEDDGTKRTCTLCFRPAAADFASAATIASRFVSSPTFTTSAITAAISGILIGAAVDVDQGSSARTVGKLYAVNTDGSVKWQFPRPGEPEIGSITSSPALGLSNTVYFTAADGNLYALASDGTFKWKFPVGTVSDPSAPFAASPLTAALIFTGTAGGGGSIFAINPDGSFHWRVAAPDQSGFVSSLAVGIQAIITPTPTPTSPPTSTPQSGVTATPSPTPTAVLSTLTVFGVTTSGMVVLIDSGTGHTTALTGTPPAIAGPVISSPALSADSFLVVGAADGTLHAVNTTTGAEPSGWPVALPERVPIRSSPAIDGNGGIYVGADDGKLYAVGTQ